MVLSFFLATSASHSVWKLAFSPGALISPNPLPPSWTAHAALVPCFCLTTTLLLYCSVAVLATRKDFSFFPLLSLLKSDTSDTDSAEVF